MTFKKTVFDKINEDIANPLRSLQDIHIDITGSKVSLLRITESEPDLLGDSTSTLSSSLIANCSIEYPFSDIEILAYADQESSLQVDAISMWDLLPVKIIMKIDDSLSTSTESINIDSNDFLVDVMYDQSGNKIPIIMKSPVLKGTFMGKHLIQKTYEATLQRGLLEDDVQTVVDNYVDNLGVPEIDSSVPVSSASGVAVDTTIAITFNVAMNQTSVANSISITPSGVVYTTSWDEDNEVMTLTPTSDLTSGVVHYVNFSEGMESGLGVPSESIESINFVTLV
jgi:hypothetical protein